VVPSVAARSTGARPDVGRRRRPDRAGRRTRALTLTGELRHAIERALGGADVLVKHGCALVMDGLDEGGTALSASLLGAARTLVAANPRTSRVLITPPTFWPRLVARQSQSEHACRSRCSSTPVVYCCGRARLGRPDQI
jgi:hypothetical protein